MKREIKPFQLKQGRNNQCQGSQKRSKKQDSIIQVAGINKHPLIINLNIKGLNNLTPQKKTQTSCLE